MLLVETTAPIPLPVNDITEDGTQSTYGSEEEYPYPPLINSHARISPAGLAAVTFITLSLPPHPTIDT